MQFIRTATTTDSSPYGTAIKIRKIYWNAPGASQSCVIKDGNGVVQVTLSTGAGNVADVNIDYNEEGLLFQKGHQITTLAAGTIYIYA